MSIIKIYLPETFKTFINEQVSQRGYSTSSEYLRGLIREDQDRVHLRNLLLASAGSVPTLAADAN